ncbi:MAG: hypothetical protein ACE5GW_11235 [Planctomycetota bacterium]
MSMRGLGAWMAALGLVALAGLPGLPGLGAAPFALPSAGADSFATATTGGAGDDDLLEELMKRVDSLFAEHRRQMKREIRDLVRGLLRARGPARELDQARRRIAELEAELARLQGGRRPAAARGGEPCLDLPPRSARPEWRRPHHGRGV